MLILGEHSNANRLVSAGLTGDSICLTLQLNQQSDQSARITFLGLAVPVQHADTRPRLALTGNTRANQMLFTYSSYSSSTKVQTIWKLW